jgi:cysteinyl-tRNA synthetase
MLQFFNTLSRQKETFKPLSQEKVKVYYCGPTVYNFAHIGNLRTYLWEDFVVRSLRFLGYKVTTTMNITDIDDKTIRDSKLVNEKLLDFTKKYTNFFLADLERLNIQKADNIQPISDIIPDMIEMINGLFVR